MHLGQNLGKDRTFTLYPLLEKVNSLLRGMEIDSHDYWQWCSHQILTLTLMPLKPCNKVYNDYTVVHYLNYGSNYTVTIVAYDLLLQYMRGGGPLMARGGSMSRMLRLLKAAF